MIGLNGSWLVYLDLGYLFQLSCKSRIMREIQESELTLARSLTRRFVSSIPELLTRTRRLFFHHKILLTLFGRINPLSHSKKFLLRVAILSPENLITGRKTDRGCRILCGFRMLNWFCRQIRKTKCSRSPMFRSRAVAVL